MKKIFLYFLATTAFLAACNKSDDGPKKDYVYNNDYGKMPGAPKLLFITIDGARGTAVQALRPLKLWEMRDSALYTWNGLSDTASAYGENWTTMLTGVRSAKSGVVGDDFSNADFSSFPTFFERLEAKKPGLRSAAFCSSPELLNEVIRNSATQNQSFASDLQTRDAAIAELGNADADVVFVQFNEVDKAGEQYGYDASVPQYAAAINTADQYVSDLMAAMQGRATYGDERWLVVVTSSRGGDYAIDPEDSDGTIFSNPLSNTFTMFFNTRFEASVVGRPENLRVPFEGKYIRLSGQPGQPTKPMVRAAVQDNGLYNIHNTDELTIEMKFKLNKDADGDYNYSYPPFLTKGDRYGSTPGWSFFRNGAKMQFWVGVTATNLSAQTVDVKDGDWHHLAGTIRYSNNSYYLSVYLDGELQNSSQISGYEPNANSSSPLRLGYNTTVFTDNTIDFSAADVRIWNTIVDDETIKTWAPRTYVNKSHKYFSHLIGYWSCLDGEGDQFKDATANHMDMTLEGPYAWTEFNDFSNYLYPVIPNQEKYVPNTVDIPFRIMEWFQVPIDNSWSLDGRSWPATFRDFPNYNQ
ncbi:hypothetical protein COR50_01380 [Chitinophaga caeni]|uniref:DUF4983 domain-containing protein n=1 Tax=Chitinophaga caeni TaxID=2029983 RepID=A0A291QPN9_9BACT|nr:LamG-like jellyroll fold domain-containing protein [Chitinophaga caeni]ATL45920.1 hypothetical protein COR50_01380 [Chitinophaga caeni]